jgi:WD40 repeat protein
MASSSRQGLKPGFRLGASFKARFSDDGALLATLGQRPTLWNVADRAKLGRGPLLSHSSEVDFSPGGAQFVVKNTSGDVLLVDVQSLDQRAAFSGEPFGEGTAIRFSPCGRYLFDGSWSGRLVVRTAETGDVVWEEREPDAAIFHLHGTRDRQTWVYDRWTRPDRRRLLRRAWPPWENEPVDLAIEHGLCFAITEDRQRLAVVGHDLEVWDISAPHEPALLHSSPAAQGGSGDSLAWSPDGGFLVHGADGAGRVFTPELDEVMTVPVEYVSDAEFSPDGRLLALGDWSKGIVVAWPSTDVPPSRPPATVSFEVRDGYIDRGAGARRRARSGRSGQGFPGSLR